MTEHSAQILQAVNEMRDLLRLMAEPAIAERNRKLRQALRQFAGRSMGKKAKAVMLMDGSRNRRGIIAECGINQGDLSVLVKKLKEAELISGDGTQPELAISIPSNFFEKDDEE